MFDVMAVYLGDRLGLYRVLDDGGPATSAELASRAGIDERYAREWLEQQAVTGILEVDDPAAAADRRRYVLPGAYRDVLLDPGQPVLDGAARPVARRLRQGDAPTAGGVPNWRWRRVVCLWSGHDRVPGRFQSAVADQLVRHGGPAGDLVDP